MSRMTEKRIAGGKVREVRKADREVLDVLQWTWAFTPRAQQSLAWRVLCRVPKKRQVPGPEHRLCLAARWRVV